MVFQVRPIDEHLFASGDEDGVVKLWDNRVSGWEGSAVMECKQFDEFVSDIYVDDAKRIMVASSGEGLVLVFLLNLVDFQTLPGFPSAILYQIKSFKDPFLTPKPRPIRTS